MGILSPGDCSTSYLQELRDPAGLAGNVGFISHSGSICSGMLTDLRRYGFSHAISCGNEAVVSLADYIDALVDDPGTRVIGLFIESIRQPERFVAALDRAARASKPVVVLKVGRNERSRRAITSHTGAITGSAGVFSAVLRAHRAIEVDDLDEMTEVFAACQARIWPKGRRIGIVTGSGGQAELILDVADAAGFELPPLPPAVRAQAESVIGPLTGDGNPLDAWGSGDFRVNYPHALQVLESNPLCDVIVLCADGADGEPMERAGRALEYANMLGEAAARASKPHYLIGMRPGQVVRAQAELLRAHGLALLGGARQGLGALDGLARWSLTQAALRPGRSLVAGLGKLRDLEKRPAVNEFDAMALLQAEGLPVARRSLATSLAQALRGAAELGYPVVLKAFSDEIAHKSEHGLVMAKLADAKALNEAWGRMQVHAAAAAASGRILGFMVQEMVPGGVEVFAGVSRSAEFGPVLAFGMGGVAIEILRDTSLRLLPLRAGQAAAMVDEIRGAALLRGARGAPACDIDALVRCLEAFADYAWADREYIGEIDLNPIKVLDAGQGCRILDALIIPRNHLTQDAP